MPKPPTMYSSEMHTCSVADC